ncbi:sodium:solute symporter family transporter, partial [Salmonella enterica]|uniref:sodium:solute symporter family transporter n=1 Tax=Salmonella enterica TaxID=28901 RepID=UPI00398C5462
LRSDCGFLVVVAVSVIGQLVGVCNLVGLLFGLKYLIAVVLGGELRMMYVVFGGMLAKTWVQIVSAVLLLFGASFIAFTVMNPFSFSFNHPFTLSSPVHPQSSPIIRPRVLRHAPFSAFSLLLRLCLSP